MKKIVACDSDSAYDATCTTLYGVPDVDMNGITDGEYKVTSSTDDFRIYVAWAAPESASTECTVCYDSVDAAVRLEVKKNEAITPTTNLTTNGYYHVWNAYWAPRYQADAIADDIGCCLLAACAACGT